MVQIVAGVAPSTPAAAEAVRTGSKGIVGRQAHFGDAPNPVVAKEKKVPAPSGPSEVTSASCAKAMLQTAARISSAVGALYQHASEAEPGDLPDHHGPDDALQVAKGDSKSDAWEVASSVKSDEAQEEQKYSDAADPQEEYDFKAAVEKVNSLLSKLRTADRADIVHELNDWHGNRAGTVKEDKDTLDLIENEITTREEETKQSMATMFQSVEDKLMREVKVLVKCNDTLQLGAKKLPVQKRRTFSRRRDRARKNSRGEDDPEDDDDLLQDDYGSDAEPVAVVDVFGKPSPEDVFDLSIARSILRDMQKEPLEHDQDQRGRKEPSAAEVLRSLAFVQEGKVALEKRAQLAKLSLETYKAAVEYLALGGSAEQASPSDAVLNIVAKLTSQVFEGDQNDEGFEIDELDEECKELEEIVKRQELEIEEFKARRERNLRLAKDMQNAKTANEDAGFSEEPVMQRSYMLDVRQDGTQNPSNVQDQLQNGPPNISFLLATQNGDPLTGLPGSYGTNFHHDPKMASLREHIKEKDGQIATAMRLLHRMRHECRLLQYCSKKAKAGIDSIVQEFSPPRLEDNEVGLDDGFDADDMEADSGLQKDNPSAAPQNDVSLARLLAEAEEQAVRTAQETAAQIKQGINDLQAQIASDTNQIKNQKVRQKALKKDIKDLRTEYANLTKQDMAAPSCLDDVKEQIADAEQQEELLRAQILQLQNELQSQNQLLGKAREDSARAHSPDLSTHRQLIFEAPMSPQSSFQKAPGSPMSRLKENTPEHEEQAEEAHEEQAVPDTPKEPTLDAHETAATSVSVLGKMEGNLTNPALLGVASASLAPMVAATAKPNGLGADFGDASEDLVKLVKLQIKNQDLKQEIDDLTLKITKLRKVLKTSSNVANLTMEAIRDIVGNTGEDEVKPPPEYFQLKREVRQKQDHVRRLRKKWWTDRKDLDNLADKVRQLTGLSARNMENDSGELQDRIVPKFDEPLIPDKQTKLAQTVVFGPLGADSRTPRERFAHVRQHIQNGKPSGGNESQFVFDLVSRVT